MKNKQPVVWDIDGTLTDEPYDETNLLTLRGNNAMVFLAASMQDKWPLVISTARPERLREQTELWLKSVGLKPVRVFMRDDERELAADQMIKYGHLLEIRETLGEPLLWVDDNDNNVYMLRRNGVSVIHAKLNT